MSNLNSASLVWPANPTDPSASTSLTFDDLMVVGGVHALRSYIAGRLSVAEASEPDGAKAWSQCAVDHMMVRAANIAGSDVKLSAAAVQVVLAYIAWLEARGAA